MRSPDMALLSDETLAKIKLMNKVAGKWATTDSTPKVTRGGRCGADGVNLMVDHTQ